MLKTQVFALFLMLGFSCQLCTCSPLPFLPSQTDKPTASIENNQTEQAFLEFLNLSTLPTHIENLKGEGTNGLSNFLSSGYFTYQADPTYFEFLTTHNTFAEPSEFNTEISELDCTSTQFPQDFSWWTDDQIDLTEKTCFSGIFFPFIHYLIYDSATGQVIHFVESMRG